MKRQDEALVDKAEAWLENQAALMPGPELEHVLKPAFSEDVIWEAYSRTKDLLEEYGVVALAQRGKNWVLVYNADKIVGWPNGF